MAELLRLEHHGRRAAASQLERRRKAGIAASDDRDIGAGRGLGRALGIGSPCLPPIGLGLELGMEDLARHLILHLARAGRGHPNSISAAPLRPKRYESSRARAISRICNTETAVMVGSISMRILSNIFFGSVICEPARNMAMTSTSKDVMKARSAAEIRLAPSPRAACSRLMSKPRSPALTTMTTKGSASTVCAIAMPYHAPISLSSAKTP